MEKRRQLIEKEARVGDYEVVALMSHHHGGEREVYRAVSGKTGAVVALTVYNLECERYKFDNGEQKQVPDFIDEVAFLRSRGVSPVGFAKVVDSGVAKVGESSLGWIAQEFSGAASLAEILSMKGAMSLPNTLKVMKVLTEATTQVMRYTRGGGHYGITIDNVLVGFDRDDNVADVKMIGLANMGAGYCGSAPFSSGECDYRFRAPETFNGIFSHRTDIYSLGMIMTMMLCGVPDVDPCLGPAEYRNAFMAGARKSLSASLRAVLDKATDVNMQGRFQMVDRFQYFLDREAIRKTDTTPRGVGGLDEVAGMAELKDLFRRNFVRIVRNPAIAKAYGITPCNCTLLYGPQGCGKTFIAEKAAQESGLKYKIVHPSDLGSIYIHGAQEKIAEMFREAEKNAPMILIFDEFDAIAPKRDGELNANQANEVNELLTRLNNCAEKGVYVLATTNRPQLLDAAVLRSGRTDMMFYVSLPDDGARREIFELELKKRPCADDIDLAALAGATENFTCSDLSFVVKECARRCFDETIASGATQPVPLSQSKILEVIKSTRSSVSEEEIKSYTELKDKMERRNGENNRPRVGFFTNG